MKKLFTTTVRLNLADVEDRKAWEHLKRMDKKQHKSYSHAIAIAINDYFDRQEQLRDDPFLESRQKEDAFLLRIEQTIQRTLQGEFAQNDWMNRYTLREGTPPQTKTTGDFEAFETLTSTYENEEDDNVALDFVDQF